MTKWIKNLREALSSIDLYKEEVTLLYKNQKAFSHPSGQIFSLCLMTLTIFSFVSLTIEMYALNSPNVITSIESDPNPQKFDVNPENFLLAFGIADYHGIPIINTENKIWWTTELGFCRQRTVMTEFGIPKVITNCTFIPMISCADNQIEPLLSVGLSIDRLSLFQCPNITFWSHVKNQTYLQGLPSSDDYSFINFRYFLCDESSQPNCATKQEIAQRLPMGFVQSIFTDRLLDQKKSNDPYDVVIKTTSTVITPLQQAFVKNTLRHSESDSITNFFYYAPTSTRYKTVTLSSQVEQLLQSSDSLYQMVFIMDDRKEIYTRTYTTFFDILGNIGGLQSFISIFLSFIVGPLTKRSQRLSLINQVFKFETNEENTFHQVELDMTPDPKHCKPRQNTRTYEKTNKELKLRRLMTQKEKKLGLKWWQTILTPAEKQALFEQGVKIFEQQLDVTNIINKLFELEKLKQLLLDEDQYRLFEYLPKPTICCPKTYKLRQVSPYKGLQLYDQFQEDENLESKFLRAKNSYKNLKNLQDLKNQRFLQMLDPQIRENFESYGEIELMQTKEQRSVLWEQID